MNQTKALIGVVALAVVLVVGFLVRHDSDARNAGKIEQLTQRISQDSIQAIRDSVVRDSLTKVTTQVDRHVAAAASNFAKSDTVWSKHRDTVKTTVTTIVNSTVPDTQKITELVALVDTTTQKADDAIKAAEVLADSVVALRQAFGIERSGWATQLAGWAKERSDMASKINLLEKLSRHWGVGAALGYGVQRSTEGVLRAGPVLAVGVVYRY